MSARALRLAVRNILRSAEAEGGLGLTTAQCEVMAPPGKPPARCGERFVAVHGGTSRNTSRDDLDEYYDVLVTVTVRIPKIPADKIGVALIDEEGGLEELCHRIKIAIHQDSNDDRVIRAANTIMGATASSPFTRTTPDDANLFVEPLMYSGQSEPRYVGSDWFRSEGLELGLAQTLTFSGARRIQPFYNMV